MKKYWSSWMAPVLLAFALSLVVRYFVFNINVVQGISMHPNFETGDVLICQKVCLSNISRGDVITADLPTREHVIVKRVIGVPGDVVHIDENGYIYVNGELIEAEYQEETPGLVISYSDVTLGEDEYYVLGDNRYESYDSRYFGPLYRSYIRDVVVARFFPFSIY